MAIEDPQMIVVSELDWQKVIGSIRALQIDYDALAKDTQTIRAQYEALVNKEAPR